MITTPELLSKEELLVEFRLLSEKFLQGEKQLAEMQFRLLEFESQLKQLRRMIYGSKSERFEPAVVPGQTSLALDTEIPGSAKAASPVQTIIYTRKQAEKSHTLNTGRLPLPANLERKQIIIEPKEDIAGKKYIGDAITEELEFEPGKLFVNQYLRRKYAAADGEGVVIGELPTRPIEKGIPGPGLLANILIEKYVDHLPCHRQIDRFKRQGVSISASTMSDWVAAGSNLIEPLYEVLKKEVLSSGYMMVDETPIKVLDKDKKGTTHRGYYWVYYSPEKKLVFFDYQPGRGRDGPEKLLQNFEGYLQTDGYVVYEKFDSPKIRLLHCMAHARRMFEEALDNDKARAEHVLMWMQFFYEMERLFRKKGLSNDERLKMRKQEALPHLQNLEIWMKEQIIQVTPKSLIGQAIAYSLSRWKKLMLYTSDGRLEIDNNLVENSIRPVALGRKNYLFAGSHQAAQRAAVIYSLLGTCKKQEVEPWQWIKNTLTVIQDSKSSQLNSLLPKKS